MKNELTILNQNKEIRINSVELTEIINKFRQEEFNILKEKGLNKKDKCVELQHKSFMKKIKKELEMLEILGLKEEKNILPIDYIDKKGEKRPCFSLNKEGVKYLLDLTKSKDKIAMQKVYEDMGGDYSKTICIDRFETTFFNKLSDTLFAMNIELDRQKTSCAKYRLDGYLPQYNIAIEYDESQHYVEPQKSKDIKRQKEVEKELGCQFIRLDYRNTDAYNIGLVIKEIINNI